MAWVKLEDTFAEHPKVQMAGDDAAWLYVSGLLYCSRALTDGFVPAAKVAQLTCHRGSQRLAGRLVDVGLWEPVEDGYRVHDYLDHQQSASERRTKRASDADRQRKRRGHVTDMSQRDNGVTHSDVTAKSRMVEVEEEVELPPLTPPAGGNDFPIPPEGGRKRERSAYLAACSSLASELFPAAEPATATKAVEQAVRQGSNDREAVLTFTRRWWPQLAEAAA